MMDERLGLPSASRMDRLAHCAGSWLAEMQFSQEEKTEASKDGDDIHEALSQDDFENLGEDNQEIALRLKQMVAAAKTHWVTHYGLNIPTNEVKEIKETRFWVRDSRRKLCSAKLDLAFVVEQSALIIDYKTGYLEVTESHKNFQMRTQAVALWQAYPKLTKIRCAIASYRFREQASATDYDSAALLKAEREIRFVVAHADNPDAERVPGEWCRYCKAKANCPQCASFGLLPIAVAKPDASDEESIIKSVTQLGLQDLAFINSKKAIAEKLFDAVNNRLRNMTTEELASVGLRLSPTERWKPSNVDGIFQTMVEEGLLSKVEFKACMNVVLGRIQELALPRLMAKGIKTKKEAGVKLKELLLPNMEKIQTAPRLVRIKKELTNE